MHVPIRERTVRSKLDEGWAYVVRDGRLLSLSPRVAVSEEGGRYDVYLADQLALTGDKPVTVVRLTGSEKRKVER